MAKHTAGPWQVMNEYDGATIVIADGTSTFSYDFVCDTLPDDGDGSRSSDIAKANARLIAAAPDMLEALRYVETRCVSEAAYPHASIEDRKMRDMVVAAIAKAEGR